MTIKALKKKAINFHLLNLTRTAKIELNARIKGGAITNVDLEG